MINYTTWFNFKLINKEHEWLLNETLKSIIPISKYSINETKLREILNSGDVIWLINRMFETHKQPDLLAQQIKDIIIESK